MKARTSLDSICSEIENLTKEEINLNGEIKSIIVSFIPRHQCDELERSRLAAMNVLSEHRSRNLRLKAKLKMLSLKKFNLETVTYDPNFENMQLRQIITKERERLDELTNIGKRIIPQKVAIFEGVRAQRNVPIKLDFGTHRTLLRPRIHKVANATLLEDTYSANFTRINKLRGEISNLEKRVLRH